MVLWPIIVLGLADVTRFLRYFRHGLTVRADRFRLAVHGLPAFVIAVVPAGTFTDWLGPRSMWALLDFPTAKVMAALWLAFTLWSAWEVQAP